MASATPAIVLRIASFSSNRSSFNGASLPAASYVKSSSHSPSKNSFSCRAQKQADAEILTAPATRRQLALTLLAGAAALTSKVSPADAAYGEAANVFGAPKKNTDFITYSGKGFTLQIPSKWNPSKEKEYPGQVLRYEDNSDTVSNVSVMVIPTDKKSIKDFGPPKEFLSQGGFDPDAVATAALLEASSSVINGKEYYNVSVLTRTADGDEGGKHQLVTATVSDGKLYVCKAQAGDKRWFKGARKFVESTASSFNVA